ADLPGGPALVECTEHRIGEPIDRQPPAAADVEDPPESPFVFQRRHPGANYVGNVDEVPALLAVAENRNRLLAQQVTQEDAQPALLGGVQRLAGGRSRCTW